MNELIRVHGREDVVGMARPNGLEIEGLLPDENATWSQHPVDLLEESVLGLYRWHVMQNRKHPAAEKKSSGNSASTASATMTSVLVPSSRWRKGSPREASISTAVTLSLAGAVDRWSARSRADLQHVVAEVTGCLHPGHELVLEHLSPLGAGEKLKVGLVHVLTCTICRWWPSLHNRSKIYHYRPIPDSWTCAPGAVLRLAASSTRARNW